MENTFPKKLFKKLIFEKKHFKKVITLYISCEQKLVHVFLLSFQNKTLMQLNKKCQNYKTFEET